MCCTGPGASARAALNPRCRVGLCKWRGRMPKTIVIAGSVAQKPRHGGHTWVFLQYLLGFRRLGWEVLFLDQLEPEMCIDEDGWPCTLEQSVNLRYVLEVMEHFGLKGAVAVL